MAVNRAQVDLGGNMVSAQATGSRLLKQASLVADTTAGASTISVAALLAGITQRSGPGAGYTDTFPAADLLLQAQPELSIGDSFEYIFRNTVAQAMTAGAGEGVVLGTNVDIAASLVREYLITVLGIGPRQAFFANVTNLSPTITNIPAANAAQLKVGQGVSGTNIPANSFLVAVNQSAGTATMNANATGTAAVAVTAFPRYSVQGIRTSTL
jgi:hypothetical protein